MVLIGQKVSTAVKDDEYFLAGKMIATSIVHGGPGSHILAEMLYQQLTGRTITITDIEDRTDDTMTVSLLEVG